MIVHIADHYTFAPSQVGWSVCVLRALTTSFEMRSRTRSGQQKLEDGIEDVTGAYVVSREPVSAMQLQVIIKRVVAEALEVPNEVNDDAIREFCKDVSLLEKTKFRGEHEYVEQMIDSEARKWLTDYLTVVIRPPASTATI